MLHIHLFSRHQSDRPVRKVRPAYVHAGRIVIRAEIDDIVRVVEVPPAHAGEGGIRRRLRITYETGDKLVDGFEDKTGSGDYRRRGHRGA